MSSNNKQSGFSGWYNSNGGKRLVGAVYSVGAAIVIIGALFKIMHWPYAGLLLSAGMITEAILFAIGVFEKPHKEYDWDKIFSFEGEGAAFTGGMGTTGATTGTTQSIQATEKLSDAEVATLSEGIKNLSSTAQQLTTLSTAIGSTREFAKNIESATEATAKFAATQGSLNKATEKLFSSYDSLSTDMNSVVDGTKQYAGKVENINKSLSSLNSIYEIQLKNIQNQNEAITSQAEKTRLITESLNEVITENQKIKQSTKTAVEEADKYKEASTQLTAQISELNKIYGNMLNSLN